MSDSEGPPRTTAALLSMRSSFEQYQDIDADLYIGRVDEIQTKLVNSFETIIRRAAVQIPRKYPALPTKLTFEW